MKRILLPMAVVLAVVAVLAGVAGAVGAGPKALNRPFAMMGFRATATSQPGACRSLMSDPAAVKAMLTLREEHLKDMQAWWGKYGRDPRSPEAQKALRELRQEHWNDMQQLFKKLGIKPPADGTSGPGMMGRGNGWTPGQGGGCRGARGWNSSPAPGVSPGAYGPGMMGSGTSL
jgi:hypothetical protein